MHRHKTFYQMNKQHSPPLFFSKPLVLDNVLRVHLMMIVHHELPEVEGDVVGLVSPHHRVVAFGVGADLLVTASVGAGRPAKARGPRQMEHLPEQYPHDDHIEIPLLVTPLFVVCNIAVMYEG